MGTICAPPNANIFMGKLESTHIYPYIRNKKMTYLRYIDDFFFWRGTKESRDYYHLQETSTKMHPSIKFHLKYSKTEIEFLDTKIYKHTNGKLCLTINRKPTDRQNYLHFKSVHPPFLKKTIPYSQALCISKICPETNEMTKYLAQLKEAFL